MYKYTLDFKHEILKSIFKHVIQMFILITCWNGNVLDKISQIKYNMWLKLIVPVSFSFLKCDYQKLLNCNYDWQNLSTVQHCNRDVKLRSGLWSKLPGFKPDY